MAPQKQTPKPEEGSLKSWAETISHMSGSIRKQSPEDAFVEMHPATMRWIMNMYPQLEHEARRRSMSVDEFVTHMLSDVYDIYADESDTDVEDNMRAIEETKEAIRTEGESIT